MNKTRIMILSFIIIFFVSIIIYGIPKFLNFMESQNDILNIKKEQTQVFEINLNEKNISQFTSNTFNIPIPNDIKDRMHKEQEHKQEIVKEENEKRIQEQQKRIELSKVQETKNVTNRSSESRKVENTEYLTFTATGYCPCSKCCGKSNGMTAMGTKASAGKTVAMSGSYKFGTRIEIKGMGTYIVEDRGGAIKGNRIDIFFSTHQEALNFGKRTVYLKIL